MKRSAGSNQYRAKTASMLRMPKLNFDAAAPSTKDNPCNAANASPDTSTATANVGTFRCGEIWGTRCSVLVHKPTYAHGKHPSATSKSIAANDPSTPSDILDLLSRDTDWELHALIAQHPHTSEDTLNRLLTNQSYDVSYWIVKNPSISKDLLKRLSLHDTPRVLAAIAAHPRATKELLDRLVYRRDNTGPVHRDKTILVNVAANLNTSIQTLRYLYRCTLSNNAIRQALASNPHTPAGLLEQLVQDPWTYGTVLITVFDNPNTPPVLFERISQWHKIASDRILARHRNTPPTLLEQLSTHKTSTIRLAIATNPNVTPQIAARLAVDPHPAVRRAIQENPNVTNAIKVMSALGGND